MNTLPFSPPLNLNMPKSSILSNAPILIPSLKPRNPFGVGLGMAKAGSHAKSEKVQRQKANRTTRAAANASMPSYGSDDAAP